MLPDKQLMKQKRGAFDFRSDGNVYIDKWNDNAIVKMTTNGQPYEVPPTSCPELATVRTNCINKSGISTSGANHILGTGQQAGCKICRRKTKNMCKKCNVRLHAERGKQCFEIYHREKHNYQPLIFLYVDVWPYISKIY
ncbi:hypothetical protein T11_5153, partial [Trichinella zimbabwensis]